MQKRVLEVLKTWYFPYSAFWSASIANKHRFQIFRPPDLPFWKFLMTLATLLATPMIWRLPEKLFRFFFIRRTLAAVSLASRGFVLERAVLGLGFFFVFLALSLVFSTPPLFATNVVWKLSQCEILIPRCRLSKKTNKKLLRHN